jgi:hypothetical protein
VCTAAGGRQRLRLRAATSSNSTRRFARSTLKIATPDAQLHKIDVWIADNDARRQRGLMFVEHMADDAGMLFIYPQPQPISMWMKNTHLSLDMLFVSANGRVDEHRGKHQADVDGHDLVEEQRAGSDRAQGRHRGAPENTAGRPGHPSGFQPELALFSSNQQLNATVMRSPSPSYGLTSCKTHDGNSTS